MSALQKNIYSLSTMNRQILDQIKELYLKYDRVISVAVSGGKDSSATAALFLEAFLEIPKELRIKEVYFLYSDTLMEILPMQVHTYTMLDNIKAFAKEHSLPIKVLHAKPKLHDTMWSLQIAKGFRPPSTDNRYCTSRLKTDVQENILYDAFGTQDIETIAIVGSRKDESTGRAKRLTENTLDGHLKGHSVYSKSLVFAPVEDYSTDDIWNTLRTSKIGKTVFGAEELYSLYASTAGEGEECQTVLGNSNKNGKNPGCSSSQGRFGCWNCALVQKKDKALTGMQSEFPYIKYLLRYRNWSVSTRDGNWDRYRDTYNHKHFLRLQYNLNNHRFGQTTPGGMSVKTRAISLLRLLYTEMKVNQSVNFELISDDELEFIQHRWILEGDFDLTAVRIAKRYGRTVKVSKEDSRLIAYARLLMTQRDLFIDRLSFWFNIHPDNRFAAQFILQMNKKFSYEKIDEILDRLIVKNDVHVVADYTKLLQLRHQFYPSKSLHYLIHREWKSDTTSFVTKALVHDYEETWGDSNLQAYDPLEDPNLSMQDKFDILDNWDAYSGEESDEKFEHLEYMRYAGNFQFTKFRVRQDEENRSKNLKKASAKAAKATLKAQTQERQQFLVFD